jgi:hypothetical protein
MIGLITAVCLSVSITHFRTPGQSKTPPGLRRLLLFGFLCLLRLLRLLRFLSHSILSGFNGLKRDTRDARRRASLAKSSRLIPADSEAAAAAITRASPRYPQMLYIFDPLFPELPAAARHAARFTKTPNVSRRSSPAVRQAFARPWAGRDPAESGTGAQLLHAIFINSKPRRGFRTGVEGPLSEKAASCPQHNGAVATGQ